MELSLKRKWFLAAIVLVACLTGIQMMFIENKPWVADYWEHKAVFLELYRNPLYPQHPVVDINVQHSFFSPYFVGFAYIGRILSISPDLLFDIISILNLLLFFCSIVLLERMVIKEENLPKSFVLLLLTIIFLWGVYPPYFSSFYHFVSLFYTSSYPATFAFFLAVLSGYLYSKILTCRLRKSKQIAAVFGCIVLNWALILTHPLTYIFAFSLYVYSLIRFNWVEKEKVNLGKTGFRKLILLALFFIVPVLFTPFWTYYSLWDLFLQRSFYGRFHSDSKLLYENLFMGYYVFVFPLGLIIYSFIQKEKQAIAILFIITGLLAVYLFGYISGSFGYGRMISFIALWLQLWLVYFLQKQVKGKKQYRIILLAFLSAFPFVYLALKSIQKAAFTSDIKYVNTNVKKDFIAGTSVPEITHRLFLFRDNIEDGALIMTDLVTSRYVAAFGGKVIASPYSEYWIPDNEMRMADVNKFFNSNDSIILIELLDKYKPKYLLLNPDAKYIRNLVPLNIIKGKIVSKNDYTLVPLSF